VWRAWIEPDALRQWWNQANEPGWRAEVDVRVGGRNGALDNFAQFLKTE
jgi:uncharacterized protein YndB with AHSA1/START domain